MHFKYFIKDQVLSSAIKDVHGEKLSKEFLEKYASNVSQGYPLSIEHDLKKDNVGHAENFRVVPMPGQENEWQLIADIRHNCDDVGDVLKGFSISWTENYRKNADQITGNIYLPYPYYNDEQLISSILDTDHPLGVGKWFKKGAAPELCVGLIASLVAFAFGPEWTNYYNNRVRPFILKAIDRCRSVETGNLTYNYLQTVIHNDSELKVYLIPDRTMNFDTLSPDYVQQGLEYLELFLNEEPSIQAKELELIKLVFMSQDEGYQIHCVQFKDGSETYFS